MNKEEILAKSREENKDQDVYEKEVMREAGNIGAIVAASVCSILFIFQIVIGQGINYGMWAIVFSMEAALFIVKSIRMKKKHEIAIAILYSIGSVMMIVAHIFNLISAASL